MKTYGFKVLFEKSKWPNEPGKKAAWCASVPALVHKGAATHGKTQTEALKNLQEVMQMVVESMIEKDEAFPPNSVLFELDGIYISVVVGLDQD